MAYSKPLSTEFSWLEFSNRLILRLQEIPLAQIELVGDAWVVRTLMHDGGQPARITVPSLDEGKAWVLRWATFCQRMLVRAIAKRLAAQDLPDLR